MKAESRPARGARAVGRIIVFILGTVWGVLAAMILTSYPVNGPAAVRHFAIWSTLLLGLAGPVCWYLAAHTEVGDRWTLGYFLAWVGWFVLGSLPEAIF
ncbi:MAG: hypothetical protein AVDCRST_MAG10-614 [uncultured Acidimicrobiales bacterium]|uniref:Uncharacterized protein n=1 Tax=uncultured Acidimicrobiales bacterium TaxID=310071 RepID=A0A6J4HBC1_9ACTN|nr:MAG: hypothetical protein AVDCRST_MAG10-614 [uncultured Acidimicrobiales bacterium]